MELNISTYPDTVDSTVSKTVLLGGGQTGKITFIVEMEEHPYDPEDTLVDITLSNAPGVSTQVEALWQSTELVEMLLDTLREAADYVR